MFDIGFWELTLIGVVALLVVGPDRLPGLARTAGIWIGRVRRFISSVKSDFEHELRSQEIQETLNKQTDFKEAYDAVQDTQKELNDVGADLSQADSELGHTTTKTGTKGRARKPAHADDDD